MTLDTHHPQAYEVPETGDGFRLDPFGDMFGDPSPPDKLLPIESCTGDPVYGSGDDADVVMEAMPLRSLSCEGDKSGGEEVWEGEETMALIKVREEMDVGSTRTEEKVADEEEKEGEGSNPKGLWESISRKLEQMGYDRDPNKCREKFNNVNKYYKKIRNGGLPGEVHVPGANKYCSEVRGPLGTQGLNESVIQPPDTVETPMQQAAFPSSSTGFFTGMICSDTDDEVTEVVEPLKHRKRRKMDFEELMQSMVDKVINQQEEMYKQVVGLMDKKESERLARDEAWKQERLKWQQAEMERRANETSCSLSLISFIKNALGNLGQEIHLPPYPQSSSSREAHPVQAGSSYPAMKPVQAGPSYLAVNPVQAWPSYPAAVNPVAARPSYPATVTPIQARPSYPAPSPVQARPSYTAVNPIQARPSYPLVRPVQAVPPSYTDTKPLQAGPSNPQSSSCTDVKPFQAEHKYPISSSSLVRWEKAELQALVSLRTAVDSKFRSRDIKGPLWDAISQSMSSLGYNRSGKKCKEKWENINKYFRKVKDSGKSRSPNSKTCQYFPDLNVLYENRSSSLYQSEQRLICANFENTKETLLSVLAETCSAFAPGNTSNSKQSPVNTSNSKQSPENSSNSKQEDMSPYTPTTPTTSIHSPMEISPEVPSTSQPE